MQKLTALVISAQGGNLDAYGEIVRRLQDMAFGYAYSVLGDFHLAEDAAQGALIQAYRILEQLHDPAAFPGWLRKLVLTQCSRMTRGKKIATVSLESAWNVASNAPEPPEAVEKREMADKVLEAIWSLSENERTVAALYYIDDYSQKDIAEFLEVPVTTVNSRLHASRKRLKERMLKVTEETIGGRRPSKDSRFAERTRAMLIRLCHEGLQERLRADDTAGRERLEAETNQLAEDVGLPFWEIAWRLACFMRERDIPFGPGRGMMPSSMIAYLLGISSINPLEFDLPTRWHSDSSRVLIHMEVCWERVEEVADYVSQNWKGRVVRAMHFPGHDRAPKVWAFVIPPKALSAFKEVRLQEKRSNVPVVDSTGYDLLVKEGGIRVSLNGSGTVTHIHRALQRIRQNRGVAPPMDSLDWNDTEPLRILGEGAMSDVLHLCDFDAMVRSEMLEKVQPRTFADLAACVAFLHFRKKSPGIIETYVSRTTKKADWASQSRLLQRVLHETRGLLLYQEQLEAILSVAVGWDSVKCRALHEAVQAQDGKALDSLSTAFQKDANRNGLEEKEARAIWEQLLSRNAYFSKSHAVGVAMLIYQAAYLKAHHSEAYDTAVAETPVP